MQGGVGGIQGIKNNGDGGGKEGIATGEGKFTVRDGLRPPWGEGGEGGADFQGELQAQTAQSAGAVFGWGAGIGGGGLDGGGEVGDADGGGGFVAFLAAGTTGAVGVDAAIPQEQGVGDFAGMGHEGFRRKGK